MAGEGNGGSGQSPLTIQIAPRTIVIAVLVVTTVWLLFRLTDFLMVLVFAVLLATAIDQPVGWLQQRGLPRPFGILALYVVLAALLGLVVAVLVPLVATETAALRTALPDYLDRLESLIHRVTPGDGTRFSLDNLSGEMSGHLSTVADGLTAVTVDIGRSAVLVFVTFVVAFFLAAEPSIGSHLLARLPPPEIYARAMPVAAAVRLRIGAWARGQLVIAILFGLLMGIGLRLLGIPYAASLGTVAGVLELFPYVGGFVTVILASLMALTVGVPQLIGVLVLYVVLVFVESHVLAPILFGRAVGLPPIAILLALLAGVELIGIAGALLAVPVTVIIWVIAEELLPDRSAGSTASPVDPVTPAGEPAVSREQTAER